MSTRRQAPPAPRRALSLFCAAALAFACVAQLASTVARAAPGDLDTTFGTNGDGRVTLTFGLTNDYGRFNAVAQYPGGKFVAAGTRHNRTTQAGRVLLARYNPDGQLDTTFNSPNGFLPELADTPASPKGEGNAVAVQEDGYIVVAGGTAPVVENTADFVVERYRPDGTRDTSFGSGGRVTLDFFGFTDVALAVAVQPDQKIVVAGRAFRVFNSTVMQGSTFALVRYNQDGSLDTTFGSGGKVTTDFVNTTDVINAMVLQPDGRILVAGKTSTNLSPNFDDFALARYTPSGALDPTFDGDGKLTTGVDTGDEAHSLALLSDGRIIVGGTQGADFALLRLNADGSRDNTFDGDGAATTNFDGRRDVAHSVVLFPDGKIVAVGGAERLPDTGGPNSAWALARYNSDGSPDPTFGTGGRVTTSMGTNFFTVSALDAFRQTDGRIVAAGFSFTPSDGFPRPTLARYLAGDSPAATVQFSQNGFALTAEACSTIEVTVTRTGDASAAASVGYVTLDADMVQKSDYTLAVGTVAFAPGETTKSFRVPVTDDAFAEGGGQRAVIALTNPVGAALGATGSANLLLSGDNETTQGPNTIDTPATFVCQHYHDFLNRQADDPGQEFWTDQITSCGADQACREARRINVSAAFFLSQEFQTTGFFALRLHRVAFGRRSDTFATRMTYFETVRDTRRLGEGVIVGEPGAEQRIEQNRAAYVAALAASPAFALRFPASLSADAYVDALYASAGVAPSAAERQEALAAYGAGGDAGRAAALRKVAESPSVVAAETNPAFVLLQYHGYLRRDPDDAGYQFWLGKLNNHGGNYVAAEMVKSFLVSGEYRARFGAP